MGRWRWVENEGSRSLLLTAEDGIDGGIQVSVVVGQGSGERRTVVGFEDGGQSGELVVIIDGRREAHRRVEQASRLRARW